MLQNSDQLTPSVQLVARVFAKKPDGVAEKVASLRFLIDAFKKLRDETETPVKLCLVVPVNKSFVDHDCGETLAALKEAYDSDPDISFDNSNLDPFCGLLNEAAALALTEGHTDMLVISPEAASNLTKDNFEMMIRARHKGAKVVGLALKELAESIRAGAIANTFALWDIVALLSVGGFDFRAANALVNDKLQAFVQGTNERGEEIFYPQAGVEEIIPLILLMRTFGRCIAPLNPKDPGSWKLPTEPTELERHIKKMATKFTRQAGMAKLVDADLSALFLGVMDLGFSA